MNRLVWRNIGRFVLLTLIQLLVLNYVYLGGYVMPMLYVLFVLMLPTGMKRIPLMLIAFGAGLTIDVASNMLGFHAMACLVVAMMRIWFADRILTRGEPVVVERPSIYNVTPQYFIAYTAILLAVFYFVLFTLEVFGLRNIFRILFATLCSTVVTTLLVVLYQWIFLKREEP